MEEFSSCIEYFYLGVKIDKFDDNTTEIRNKIIQLRKLIKVLNLIWWNKVITKNIKLYIYKTIIQSVLTYGSEVWQIPNTLS